MKNIRIIVSLLFFWTALPVFAQNDTPTADSLRPLTLRITNKRNKPVSGMAIQAINSDQTAVTDASGQYTFSAVGPNEQLLLFLPKQKEVVIPTQGMDSLHISLSNRHLSYYDINRPDQLIDMGYYKVSRANSTHPANSLNAEKIREQSGAQNLIELLQGRVAGLDIRPDGSATIRGTSSFLLSSEPLIVIDGFTFNGTLRDASSVISVYDIESVNVLKEGSMYGSQGANGVILITTKK